MDESKARIVCIIDAQGTTWVRQWENIDLAMVRAMEKFEEAAPPDAYTRKGVEAVLRGMGLISDEC